MACFGKVKINKISNAGMAQGGGGKIFYMCDSDNEECDEECGRDRLSPNADAEEDFKMKPSSSLQVILASISQARNQECAFVSRGTVPRV